MTFLWRSAGKPTPKTKNCPFADVEGDHNNSWYRTAVLWAVENNITNGTSATTFSPNDPVTRGQLITFLYRTKGGETQSGANWYTAAEQWASNNGLLKGTAKAYSTNGDCPREDVVYYLWREMKSNSSGNSGNSGNSGQSDEQSWEQAAEDAENAEYENGDDGSGTEGDIG